MAGMPAEGAVSATAPDVNTTDILINGIEYDAEVLERWNYTLYSNATLSNGSNCWLVFEEHKPFIFANGTFVNGTSCFTPIKSIGARGACGLAFGTLFAISILFSLINLRKHGRSFLPREKRWRAVGRRWQWYWMIFVATAGIISCFSAVDVDRDYLPSTALILQSFFYTLMFPALLACVWEAVRHWGSWQERQLHDADAFTFRQNDRRAHVDFYLPLVFYTLAWLVFFMSIPRPWTPVQLQRSPEQTAAFAEPATTDGRFKSGAFLSTLAFVVICYSLLHSIYHYTHKPARLKWSPTTLIRHVPVKFVLIIPLLAIRIAYAATSSFLWPTSPYNISANPAWLYTLGYTPALLIMIILNVYGYADENDDKLLIAQRARRGDTADQELTLLRTRKKPHPWSVLQGKREIRRRPGQATDSFNFANTISGAGGKGRLADDEDATGAWWWQRRKDEESQRRSRAGTAIAPASARYIPGSSLLMQDDGVAPRGMGFKRDSSATRSERSGTSTSTGTLQARQPQVVRSMLDV